MWAASTGYVCPCVHWCVSHFLEHPPSAGTQGGGKRGKWACNHRWVKEHFEFFVSFLRLGRTEGKGGCLSSAFRCVNGTTASGDGLVEFTI